jgi:hypothetical protein
MMVPALPVPLERYLDHPDTVPMERVAWEMSDMLQRYYSYGTGLTAQNSAKCTTNRQLSLLKMKVKTWIV